MSHDLHLVFITIACCLMSQAIVIVFSKKSDRRLKLFNACIIAIMLAAISILNMIRNNAIT